MTTTQPRPTAHDPAAIERTIRVHRARAHLAAALLTLDTAARELAAALLAAGHDPHPPAGTLTPMQRARHTLDAETFTAAADQLQRHLTGADR